MDQAKLEQNKKLPAVGFHTNPEWINRKGRPKSGQALTDVMREMFEAQPEMKKKIMMKLYEMAESGNLGAITEILDRIEGKPHQSQDVDMSVNNVVVVPDEVYKKYGIPSDTETSSGK